MVLGETAFYLIYGREVKTIYSGEDANQETLRLNLGLIDEVREATEVSNVACAQQVARYYNFRVKNK
ncbi:hypothetical protein EPI10_023831 [Gossypium australe]|uniref:Uncharacterized protein n=1 Tax=Gossypium australe TaxID=47621 RepID=A0A5B6VXA3_9ROSI|nr:hypothetical protein EPI10_023831 [Gossypium australe]